MRWNECAKTRVFWVAKYKWRRRKTCAKTNVFGGQVSKLEKGEQMRKNPRAWGGQGSNLEEGEGLGLASGLALFWGKSTLS